MAEQSVEELYDSFSVQSWDLPQVMESFSMLKRKLKAEKLYGLELYKQLKVGLSKVWKAKDLLSLLDKRANQKEYVGQKAAKDICVLIIGAGPVGLRLAIDCILLGSEVIVIEKRTTFSRNNVLHLWPFTIDDLRQLGAKKFYGKFCAGAIDHVSIRSLQCILLKICLLLGVKLYYNVEFLDILEPDGRAGWRAGVKPGDHSVSKYEFDFIVDAGGARTIRVPCFDRKELRGKLALAITANFKNYNTRDEAAVDEISGVAFIFNQKFFKELNAETGIDLENIVYYKDETHYFVMTAKKESLIKKGVLKADFSDAKKLLSRDNIVEEELCKYSVEAASWSTDLPKLDFASNHHNKRDVALFDFTSIHQTEHAAKAIKKGGKVLYLCLAGDSLLEPFWPQGTGCARGFLGAMDTAWLIRGVGQGKNVLDLLCEREIIFQRLPQTTPQKLQKNTEAYTIDPRTRYRNLNLARKLHPEVMERLYLKDDSALVPSSPSIKMAASNSLSGKEAGATKSSKQKQDQGTVPEVPARDKKEGTSSSSRKKFLEKGTVHRAYYVNVDDFNTLKSHRALKQWLKKQVEPYGIKITDLSSSWSSGLALCAIIHRFRPDLIPNFDQLSAEKPLENNQLAFSMAEQHLGISSLINPAEMESPDRLALVTYLSLFYELFHGSQPVTLPTGAEHDSKAKKPKVSHENSTISTKKSATSEVISTETSTSIKKPTSTTEKQVTSTEKLKSTEQSFTSSRKPSEEQASSDKKLVSVATSSTSSQKPVTSPEKQVSSSQKPFTSSEKHVTSAEKFKSVEKSSQKPLEKQVTSAEKPSSVEKSSRKLFISSIVSTENQASSAETQATSTSRQVTTIEKPGTPAEKLVEKVASAEKCTTSAETEQVETPPKKKSKKRKFRLFRRNKKKSLATATPSIERKWTTKERPRFGQGKSSKEQPGTPPNVKEGISPATSTTPKSIKTQSHGSTRGQQFQTPLLDSSDFCHFCGKRVYVMERMSANGCFFHRNCFRCSHCNCQLQMGNYAFSKREGGEKGKFFCSPHYRQLFLSHPEVINYSRAREQAKEGASNQPSSVANKDEKAAEIPICEEDENEVSNGAEETVGMNKKSKSKKSKKIPKLLEAAPSEPTKSPESPKIPKSAKVKKPSWFRKRSSSDSKAMKPKSTKNGSSPLELASSTPISPLVTKPSQDLSKPPSTTAAKRSTGSVKRLSAFFEGLDKPPEGSQREKRPPLSVINEESRSPTANRTGPSRQTATTDKQTVSRTVNRGQKNLTRPVTSSYSDSDVAIRERRKQQERFIEAQIIQREMGQLETQREELEEDGRVIEEALRNLKDPAEEDELMEQWLNLINERSGLEKRVAELTLKMKELELEDRQYEIDKELYELGQIPLDALTSEERERFDSLSEQKLKVVIERNEIVDQMEEDRMQELKELEESTDVGIEGGSSETSEGSSQGEQISSVQPQIAIGNEFKDHTIVVEYKSLSSDEVIDLSPVEADIHLNDTPRAGQIIVDSGISADGSLTHETHQGRDEIQPVHQTTYFSVAEMTAHVPFLDHQMLECDCNGREYTNVDHDITLRIPEGAVAEGKKVHFEVAVTMYGPFNFPENTKLISPILWLCLLEEAAELKKPLEIVLPHYLTGNIDQYNVGFMKANHNDYEMNDSCQMFYNFRPLISDSVLVYRKNQGYAVTVTDHLCYLCLAEKESATNDSNYCLARVESPQDIIFCASYLLPTCIKAIKQQYPGSTVQFSKPFKFKEPQGSLKIIVEPSDCNNKCLIALEPRDAKIGASEIDFTSLSHKEVNLMHDIKTYPPRVKMSIYKIVSGAFIIPVKIDGCLVDGKLNTELLFRPEGLPPHSPNSASLSDTNSQASFNSIKPWTTQSHLVRYLTENNHPALLEQLQVYSAKWKEIGSSLGFCLSELEEVQARPVLLATAPRSWLSAMLAQWLQWAPGDSRGSTNFATLDALKTALNQAGLGVVAHNLKSN